MLIDLPEEILVRVSEYVWLKPLNWSVDEFEMGMGELSLKALHINQKLRRIAVDTLSKVVSLPVDFSLGDVTACLIFLERCTDYMSLSSFRGLTTQQNEVHDAGNG